MESHHITSIATGSMGLLILLFLPLDVELNSVWLPLTALPYFVLYGRDLVRGGYRASDLPRVFAFNLMLAPIHLAGVLKSIQQGITGERIPFGRTPKVSGRTAAPRWAVLAMWGMMAWCLMAITFDAMSGRWLHVAFAAVTAMPLAYAVATFIGIRASIEDATRGWALPGVATQGETGTRMGDRPAR